MAKENLSDYQVQAKLNLWVAITVRAKSLEDALAKAATLKESDFVDFKDEYLDGSMEISGVFKLDN